MCVCKCVAYTRVCVAYTCVCVCCVYTCMCVCLCLKSFCNLVRFGGGVEIKIASVGTISEAQVTSLCESVSFATLDHNPCPSQYHRQ